MRGKPSAVYSDRGEQWPSMADAARALGYRSKGSLWNLVDCPGRRARGRRLTTVRADLAPPAPARPRGHARTPVWSDRPGEQWPSLAAAAAALGRSRTAVWAATASPFASRCAGRRLFREPPEWAVAETENAAAAGAERERRAERERMAVAVIHPGCGGVAGSPPHPPCGVCDRAGYAVRHWPWCPLAAAAAVRAEGAGAA